jgi:hypothetical protein
VRTNVKTNNKSWPPKWITPVDDEALETSRGRHAINFINAMCIQTKDTVAGKAGQPIVLRDWQEDLLTNIFALNESKKLKFLIIIRFLYEKTIRKMLKISKNDSGLRMFLSILRRYAQQIFY